jgi:MFS family permease
VAGAVLLLGFFAWEWRRRDAEPLVPLQPFRDPALTMLAVLHGVVQFTLIGQMIVMSLYLQSVLGMSAVVAGMTGLPLTIVLTAVAPYAGKLSDRIGSKAILVVGFLVYAVGMILLGAELSLDAGFWTFCIPFAMMGLGMGCLFAPMTTEALRRSPAQFTGALSGVLNTTRQLGGLVGGAVVGAVLAGRLLANMVDLAAQGANQLPASLRPAFLAAFQNASGTGLQVGRGQAGGAQVPKGLSGPAAEQFQNLIHDVFNRGYVEAARFTLWIPAVLLLASGLLSLLFLRTPRASASGRPPGAAATAAPEES